MSMQKCILKALLYKDLLVNTLQNSNDCSFLLDRDSVLGSMTKKGDITLRPETLEAIVL